MQLEHMEVVSPGTQQRHAIGPLSSGLNALVGPRGSGKTRLLQWLRLITLETYGSEYLPYHAPHAPLLLYGSVDLLNRGLGWRLTQDSTGQVRIQQRDSRQSPSRATQAAGDNARAPHQATATDSTILNHRQRQAFELLATASNSADSQPVLDDIAVRLGLDVRQGEQPALHRDRWLARERELIGQLDRSGLPAADRQQLISQRRNLQHQLDVLHQADAALAAQVSDSCRLSDRLQATEADLQSALAEVEHCQREISDVKAQLKLVEITADAGQIDPGYRQQLQQLEDRLDRWRRTLRDIKTHRQHIQQQAVEVELDCQTGSQLSDSIQPDPRAPLRSLEAQLHNARKQLDQLVEQHLTEGGLAAASDRPVAYQVHRDVDGRTHISFPNQPATAGQPGVWGELLASMQRDLHNLCHQLSRQQAQSAATTLKQQIEQLQRCENELLGSVQQLIEQRGELLRRIGDQYGLASDQLALAFGQWCQCHDHPQLRDWLLREDRSPSPATLPTNASRIELLETLERLEAQRKNANLRAEECRRQLRQAGRRPLPQAVAIGGEPRRDQEQEMRDELAAIESALRDLDNRDRLQAELDEVRHQLAKTPVVSAPTNEYRQSVNRHIIGLSGSLYHRHEYQLPVNYSARRQSDTIQGVTTEHPTHRRQYEVPDAIVRTAQRLAIAQALASRGDEIPVFLDQTLDGLDAELQRAAVAYLARIGQRLQIIVLTDDRRIADLVRQHRGTVHSLVAAASSDHEQQDLNQLLSAYANDQEASKWYRPMIESPTPPSSREFYLNDHSLIEQLPVMQRTVAARCRALGIDRISDLLDVEPAWLADHLRLPKITETQVRNWQALAQLLCSVRNLRPFDARVLIGAGIRTAAELSRMRPSDLLARVERFLATDSGRKLLRSGNSYELSRITSWIAAAGNGSPRYARSGGLAHRSRSTSGHGGEPAQPRPTGGPSSRQTSRSRTAPAMGTDRHRQPSRAYPALAEPATNTRRRGLEPATVLEQDTQAGRSRRFHLELASPIIQAPSIGERMAQRLQAHGIDAVDQLLTAHPDALAQQMNLRRVTAETVRQWQAQAELVCRIPHLRGHDAQLLVACNLTSPEILASMTPESVLEQVTDYVQTSAGQRVLRGGQAPDLTEVSRWIACAAQCRSLNAA